MEKDRDPRIISEELQEISPWVSIMGRTIESNGKKELYHSLVLNDYVTVIAQTDDGRVPVIRQYRPALKTYALEFPGGHLEKGESTELTVRRELYEETGFASEAEPQLLGCLNPNTGRMENKLWAYYLPEIKPAHISEWEREPIECRCYTPAELYELIRQGAFCHALDLSLVSLALVRGVLKL